MAGRRPHREPLIAACVAAEWCRFVECADGCDDCCSARAVVDANLASVFCLVPPGDTPTRRAFFDALLTGCVPVVKTRRTADYAWYLCRRRR